MQVKFFERRKDRVFHHSSSINFNCGRFESGWLVYTDMVETSKVCAKQHYEWSLNAMQPLPSSIFLRFRLHFKQAGQTDMMETSKVCSSSCRAARSLCQNACSAMAPRAPTSNVL